MYSILGQIPFFRLLVPIFAAILFNRYFPGGANPLWVCAAGALAMMFSYLIPQPKRFGFRWLFGAGLMAFIAGLALFAFHYHTSLAAFAFPQKETDYVGVVLEIPQEKPKSIACNMQVVYPVKKKIVVYVQQSEESFGLSPGDKMMFRATVQPFRNLGNPDDFNYAGFMQMRGFAGSAYISADKWMPMKEKGFSLFILAQQVRKKIIDFFRSFDLTPDQYAFISALIIGYKGSLSNDIQDAFNASGTSHVLAVSGYHVGVIYLILVYLLGFMGGSQKQRIIKQSVIIAALWVYVFITGLPISVIRSAIMLSVFCLSDIFHKRGFTYNTMAIAAFLILMANPYSFFDLGFQLSFASVFSILYFQPKFSRVYNPKNRYGRYAWQLLVVSLAAQIGVFPLILYYFGTFPSYFFVANVLVVPLTGVIMYAFFPLLAFSALRHIHFGLFDFLYGIARWVVEFLINFVLEIVYFIETLPYAQLTGIYISMFQMVVVFAILYAGIKFLQHKKGTALAAALGFACILALSFSRAVNAGEPARWMIFNKPGFTDIGGYQKGKRTAYAAAENGFLPHASKRILRLSENRYARVSGEDGFPVDVLILSRDASFSLYQLHKLFRPGIIVLDSSLPRSAANRIGREGGRLGLEIHDVSQMGAFSVDF